MEINHWARLVASKLVKKEIENPDSDLIILGHYGGWSTYKQDAWAGYGMKVQDLINSFIVVGPPGATGPAGPQGLSGPIGLQGSTGPIGPQGISGSQGLQGPTGPQGPQGDPGTSINPEGFVLTYTDLLNEYGGTCEPTQPNPLTTIMLTGTGVNGTIYVFDPTSSVADVCGWVNLGQLAGASGNAGPQGPQGTQGPQGPAGAAGPQGLVGPQGPAGVQGPTGPTGPIGNTGTSITGVYIDPITGYPTFYFSNTTQDTVTTSLFGPQGVAGPQGSQGPIGLTGPAGPAGAAGPQGIQGIQGIPGVNGNIWYNGTSVPANSFGTNNDYFIINATGQIYKKVSGVWVSEFTISGPQGVQGPQGPIGNTGATGAVGPQGPAGQAVSIGFRTITQTSPAADFKIKLGTTGSDLGKVLQCETGTSPMIILIPLSTSTGSGTTEFPVGGQVILSRNGVGSLQIQPESGSGVTIRSADSMTNLRSTYSMATLMKLNNTTWYLVGDISPY